MPAHDSTRAIFMGREMPGSRFRYGGSDWLPMWLSESLVLIPASVRRRFRAAPSHNSNGLCPSRGELDTVTRRFSLGMADTLPQLL